MNIYLEKKSFHESQDPFCTLQGLGTFDGYIAYVHSNGCVVLEKYFDNVNTGRVSMGDAIYIMDFSDFHRLSQLTKRELIDSKQCKRVLVELFENPRDPEDIIKEKGWIQISDEGEIKEIVLKIIEANPQSVADFKGGKDRALGFLVGQAMKETKGKANPQMLNKMFLEELKK